MIDVLDYPLLFKSLAFADRLKASALGLGRGAEGAAHNLDRFYEHAWRDAAHSLGAEIEHLGCGVFEISLGRARTRVLRNTTSIDDYAAHCVVRSKPVIYGLLSNHGLPVPRYAEFTLESLKEAAAFMEGAGRQCVVKPIDGGGGQGVITGVRTRWQLARAARAAARFASNLIIEEQVEGDNYRLLYLDGKLIDAVVRRPPSVVADGRSTVRGLVSAANAERSKRGATISHSLLTVDRGMQNTLASQGLKLDSIPEKGTVVVLKTATNENSGSDNVTATGAVCDALIDEGAEAALLAGVRLAGVDVITTDPQISLKESGGVILEVNSPPGYYWHYHKSDGSFPVGVHVLKAILGI